MYACSAPTIDDENQMMAAHFGPSVTTEPAKPASKKPGLHNPTTKPSHQCIVFNRRRSSTAISAMGSLQGAWGACREAAILPNGVAGCWGPRNNPNCERADPCQLRVRPHHERDRRRGGLVQLRPAVCDRALRSAGGGP